MRLAAREEEKVEKSIQFGGKFEYDINSEDDDKRVSMTKQT